MKATGVLAECSSMSHAGVTHQQHAKMCQVITETSGLIIRNSQSLTAAAAPTTLPL